MKEGKEIRPCALFTLEELLLELGLGDLNLDRLVDLLLMSTLVVGIVLDGGGEECVDEGGFSEARFASNLGKRSVSKSFVISVVSRPFEPF